MSEQVGAKIPSSGLPAGTVTFLFTDIEGSTELLRQLKDQYASLLADQRRILREIFSRWHGQEVDTQGDEFFYSFPRASEAVNAAIEVQRALAEHAWPEDVQVKVRIGLHTGEPSVKEGGYVGMDVHRAARIGHVGHGGQVLLSETTTELVRDELPEGVNILDLGKYQLKSMSRPERIYQLEIGRLPSDFPPLKSPESEVPPSNLPDQPTPFVGRIDELKALDEMISNPANRLISIIGAGGMGKSRLAISAAEQQILVKERQNRNLKYRFPDGVFFVRLAPLQSIDAVIPTIAEAVGFQFYEGVEPKKQLLDFLREKQLLLLIDNFEHLMASSTLLTDMLKVAPSVKTLVTSREKLNLRGEVVFLLTGMKFPNENEILSIDKSFSAVELFLQSTRSNRPEYNPNEKEMNSIGQICRLVEGLPLGLEMAASWMDVLTPSDIVTEIQRNIDFLELGKKDVPERQKSIRAVFDYTWKMLSNEEQEILIELSVFRGGFTAEAAREVTGATNKLLLGLVHKSLIHLRDEDRFDMHELFRQYTMGKQGPEREILVRNKHSRYFAEFVHHRESKIRSGDLNETLREMDNLRSGLKWAFENMLMSEIRMQIQSLWWLYRFKGWSQEAIDIFEPAVSNLGVNEQIGETRIAYGQILSVLGMFYEYTGQREKGRQYLQKGQEILRHLGARLELAWTNNLRGIWGGYLNYAEVEKYFQESLAIYEEMNQKWGVAFTYHHWGINAQWHGRYEEAERYHREALQISSDLDDSVGMAAANTGLGWVALGRGNYHDAIKMLEEGCRIYDAIDNKPMVGDRLEDLGYVALLIGDLDEALSYNQDAHKVRVDLGDQIGIALSIAGLGNVAFALGEYEIAAIRYQEALKKSLDIGDQNLVCKIYGYLGSLAFAMGDYQDARAKYYSALEIAVGSDNVWLCLEVISMAALIYEVIGITERGLELLAFVQDHPQIRPFERERATKLMEKMGLKFQPDIILEAQERSRNLDVQATAEEMLALLEREDLVSNIGS